MACEIFLSGVDEVPSLVIFRLIPYEVDPARPIVGPFEEDRLKSSVTAKTTW